MLHAVERLADTFDVRVCRAFAGRYQAAGFIARQKHFPGDAFLVLDLAPSAAYDRI